MDIRCSGLLRFVVCLGAGWITTGTAFGHHAFTAQYDSTRPVSLTGVVVKIEWLNPHAYFFVDVENEATGEIVTWASEMGSPVTLTRQGWSRNSMKIGDIVAVEGLRARDGSALLNARSVTLTSTGRKLFTRSAAEERSAAAETEPGTGTEKAADSAPAKQAK